MLGERSSYFYAKKFLLATMVIINLKPLMASTDEGRTLLFRSEIHGDIGAGARLGQPFNSFTRRFTGTPLLAVDTDSDDMSSIFEGHHITAKDSFNYWYESDKAAYALDNHIRAAMPQMEVSAGLSYQKESTKYRLIVTSNHFVILKTEAFNERRFRPDMKMTLDETTTMGTSTQVLKRYKDEEVIESAEITNPEGLRSFIQKSGTHFIDSRYYGFSCTQKLVFTFEGEEQKLQFQTALSGEAGTMKADLLFKIGAIAQKNQIKVERSFEMKLPKSARSLYTEMIANLANELSLKDAAHSKGSPEAEVKNFGVIEKTLIETFSKAVERSENNEPHLIGYGLADYSLVSAETKEDTETIKAIHKLNDAVIVALNLQPTVAPKKGKAKKASKT